MLTSLNIAVLCAATCATLSALSGDTWDKEKIKHPIHRRINVRGWISVLCLTLAVCLGIIKEFETRSEDRHNAALAAQQKMADESTAVANEKALTDKLAESQRDLTKTRDQLDHVLSDLEIDEKLLGRVQDKLDSTRTDLFKANTDSLIGEFVGAQKNISSVLIVVPLNVSIRGKGDLEDNLLPSSNQECERKYWSYYDDWSIDPDLIMEDPDPRVLKGVAGVRDQGYERLLDGHDAVNSGWAKALGEFLHSTPPNQLFLVKKVDSPPGTNWNAAGYVGKLTRATTAFSISATPITESCGSGIRERRVTAFSDAVLIVVVDAFRNDAVIYKLTAGPERPMPHGNGYQIDFTINSEPKVIIMPVRNLISEMDSIERSNIYREGPFWFER